MKTRKASLGGVGCVTSSGPETRAGDEERGDMGRGRRCNCQSNVSPEILRFRSGGKRRTVSKFVDTPDGCTREKEIEDRGSEREDWEGEGERERDI